MGTKQMQRPEDRDYEVEDMTRSRHVQQRPHFKTSKSLEFSDTNNTLSPVLVTTSPNETY